MSGLVLAYGRIGHVGPRATAVVAAGAGFVAFYMAPFLKYPASPPSVSQSSTIGHRTELYFGVMLISVRTIIGAHVLGPAVGAAPKGMECRTAGRRGLHRHHRRGVRRHARRRRGAIRFPATLLWRFRVVFLATRLTLWTAIGVS